MIRSAVVLALLAASCSSAEDEPLRFGYPMDDTLRVNHVQMKGTHNSYHLRGPPPVRAEFDYEHPPLTKQLDDEGIRQFELDLHFRSDYGRFAVFHLPGLDDHSSCPWFTDCLAELKRWSDAHRGHHPLFVFMEMKDLLDPVPDKIVGARYADLEAELLSEWRRDRILTPDDVRGKRASLSEAVEKDGWPTLGATRGKIVFVMLDDDHTEAGHLYEYTRGNASLDGRLMFVTARDEDPFAAILSINDPGNAGIEAAVKRGRIVRTIADSGMDPKDPSTWTSLPVALAGPAQIISTDYPIAGVLVDYFLDLVGGTPSRCAKATAPENCTSAAIEEAGKLQPIGGGS
jgi:hypothetical protein